MRAIVPFVRRVLLAAVCGWWIAAVVTAVVLDVPYAAGGYTSDSLVELPPGVIWYITGTGALAAAILAGLTGHRTLAPRCRPVALGALAGVGVVVAVTLITALTLATSGRRDWAGAVMTWGLFAGVPVAVVCGGAIGRARWSEHLQQR
jgi:hypothetical protein